MTPMQKHWISFKTHFCTANRELKVTGKLTMEDAGYHEANLVKNIVAHVSGLPFTIPTPNPAPTIVRTVQPTPVTNVATDVSNILSGLLTSMQHIQQLLTQMHKIKQEEEDKQATTTPALSRNQLNQDSGNITSPYQNFPTNISGHTGSMHMKEYCAEIKRPSTRIQQPSP